MFRSMRFLTTIYSTHWRSLRSPLKCFRIMKFLSVLIWWYNIDIGKHIITKYIKKLLLQSVSSKGNFWKHACELFYPRFLFKHKNSTKVFEICLSPAWRFLLDETGLKVCFHFSYHYSKALICRWNRIRLIGNVIGFKSHWTYNILIAFNCGIQS